MAKINFKQAGKNILMRTAGAAGGGLLGYGTDAALPNMDPKIRAAIKLGVGAIAPELAPKVKFLDSAGAGLVGAGAQDMAKQLFGGGTVSGNVGNIGADEEYVIDVDSVSGPDDNDALGGDDNAMGGIDEDEY